jgi:RNA polymerase sigma-70 factor (ECF subfamily)
MALADFAPPVDEDVDLVARFRRGERLAFDALVRKYQRSIYYLTLRYVKDADDAKDLAQRAFVRAFEALDGFRGGSTFRTWLYRIAVNLSLNHLRDHSKQKVDLDDALTNDALTSDAIGASRILSAEDRGRLRDAIELLPPKQRLVLELRVFEELSFREVAAIADCTENAAKVNFHLAVKRLREELR